MSHSSTLLAVVATSALLACGFDSLRAAGVRTFDEVEPEEAARTIAEGTGVLVQVLEPESRRVGAPLVAGDEPLPAFLESETGPVVIVADEGREARRLAARLVRSGVERVLVVRGGIEAWLAARGGSETPAAAHAEPRGSDRET